MKQPDRAVLAIGGGVLAIVVLAVAVVLAIGEPDVTDYPAETPEGTIQRYLRAAYDGDDEAAIALLSVRAGREMSRDPINGSFCQASDGHHIRIDGVDTGDDRAIVRLRIEDVSGSGLGFDRYSWERSVALVLEDSVWKIDEPYFCA
ncbi:MAG TPA: hypothetical protein VEX37_13440 [Thermomicrobiales bacterium]|nr:hypothetical protein [Thermomicrobiales bacterium]